MANCRRVCVRLSLFAAACAGVLSAYWHTLTLVAGSWVRDPVHSDFGPSHGAFVPVFALIILWSRRGLLRDNAPDLRIVRWLGLLLLLLVALPLRWLADHLGYVSLDAFSLLPSIAGLTMLLGGMRVLRASWPSILLLVLMLPWPYPVETAVTEPLRHFVAAASTFLLQTLGYPVFLDGAVMWIEDIRVEVIDACSGLGMLLTFLALAFTIAFLSQAPRLNRAILVVSSLAFAVFVNVLRITATGAAYYAWGPGADTAFVHDLAGWLMMPTALLLLWLEIKLLERLLLPVEQDGPLAIAYPMPLRRSKEAASSRPLR